MESVHRRLLVDTILYAVLGALAGLIFVGWLLRLAFPALPPVGWELGVLGAFLGSVVGAVRAALALRRTRLLRQSGQAQGLAPLKGPSAADGRAEAEALEQVLARLLATSDSLHVENMLQREVEHGRLLIADMQRISGGEDSTTIWQTIAVLFTGKRDLPEFQLEPGTLLESLRFCGLPRNARYAGLEFPEDEAFSRAYILGGNTEPILRHIFAAELRQLLMLGEWVFSSHAGTLVLFRPGRRIEPDGLQGFLDSAQAIFREATVPTSSPSQAGEPVPTLVAPSWQASMKDIDALLDQPPPRRVDLAPWLGIMWGFGVAGAVWAVLVALFGLVFTALAIYVGRTDPMALTFAPAGILVTVLAVWSALFPWLRRRRRRRMLRLGIVVPGTIRSLRGSVTAGDFPVTKATVEYQVDGQTFVRRFKCLGHSAVLAERFHEAGRNVRVLYDPRRPRDSLLHIALPLYVLE